jgi:6-pyruvoyltetrahydropterin/6-carboxytetrahydropterin synthase
MYRIVLNKEYLVFSAAHFITYNGNVCERLHGHNYRVTAEVRGPLDENHYVVDFIRLRDALHNLVMQLDHRVLLPTQHPLINVTVEQDEVMARFEQRRWVFPREDCVLSPIANTTAEKLAWYLGQQLLEKLAPLDSETSLEIGVDENHGQWAMWRSG